MLDWFVVLTPVVVLAVVLLLGFAGCHVVFGLDPPPYPLRLEVRVPATLTVEFSRFRYTVPGTTSVITETMLTRVDESPDVFVLFHEVPAPPPGMWQVNCRLEVKDASGTQASGVAGDFSVGTGERVIARWEATGSPATNDFQVVFIGSTVETE